MNDQYCRYLADEIIANQANVSTVEEVKHHYTKVYPNMTDQEAQYILECIRPVLKPK